MQFFPVISTVNGAILTGTSIEGNAKTLAASINVHAGAKVATVGAPIVMNPSYSKAKDPERVMLTALVTAARAVTGAALATVEAAANGQAPAVEPETVKTAARKPAANPTGTRRVRATTRK